MEVYSDKLSAAWRRMVKEYATRMGAKGIPSDEIASFCADSEKWRKIVSDHLWDERFPGARTRVSDVDVTAVVVDLRGKEFTVAMVNPEPGVVPGVYVQTADEEVLFRVGPAELAELLKMFGDIREYIDATATNT